MFEVRTEADFSAAHFLSRYEGKCENLHGHNYRVRMIVRGEVLGEGGMLVDFAALKKVLAEIISPLDHTNLNDIPEFEQDPSAERIAFYIFNKADALFPKFGVEPKLLHAIEVFESPKNMARYVRD